MVDITSETNGDFYMPITKEKTSFPKLPVVRDNYNEKRFEDGSMGFWGGFLLAVLLIGFLVIGGFGVYYVKEGMFKSTITQDVTLEQNITNNYKFNPETSNTYNNEFKNFVNVTVILDESIFEDLNLTT